MPSFFFPFLSMCRPHRAFTLIELLLVIGIIAILAAIVIVAINPTKQLGSARDAQRRSDVNTILNAIYQYAIDNNGALPGYLSGAIAGKTYQVCNCNSHNCPPRIGSKEQACGLGAGAPGGMINFRQLSGTYVVSIPTDPQSAKTDVDTNYMIMRDTQNRITVSAPATEQTAGGISVTR